MQRIAEQGVVIDEEDMRHMSPVLYSVSVSGAASGACSKQDNVDSFPITIIRRGAPGVELRLGSALGAASDPVQLFRVLLEMSRLGFGSRYHE